MLNPDDRSSKQARVKSRIGEKRVKDPVMKDDSRGWECFALLCKLGLNPDKKKRVKDPLMKDDSGEC